MRTIHLTGFKGYQGTNSLMESKLLQMDGDFRFRLSSSSPYLMARDRCDCLDFSSPVMADQCGRIIITNL